MNRTLTRKGPVPRPMVERFWEKVDKSGECWTWTASTDRKGYGKIGRPSQHGGWMFAHRLSFEIANGPIPDGMFVCHSCDNPPCVNPDHLWLGTHADNMVDMSKKGRSKYQQLTHCKWGHDLGTAYVYNGRRRCRDCSHNWYMSRKGSA